jgi:hypothetical protein
MKSSGQQQTIRRQFHLRRDSGSYAADNVKAKPNHAGDDTMWLALLIQVSKLLSAGGAHADP